MYLVVPVKALVASVVIMRRAAVTTAGGASTLCILSIGDLRGVTGYSLKGFC